MNKKLRVGTALLSLLSSPVALADEPTGRSVFDGFTGFLAPDWDKDFSLTLGTKVWINEWTLDRFITNPGFARLPVDGGFVVFDSIAVDTQPDELESNIEPVPIPQISMRYKWLVLSGSYYSKTDFDFEQATITSAIFLNDVLIGRTTGVAEATGERFEWDVGGGILLHPYVALLTGYKKVRQQFDFRFTSRFETFPRTETLITTDSQDIDIEGPTIGIAASVPFGRGFGVYANYAHGFMDATLRGSGEFDATYDVAELGFSYTLGTEGLMPHMPLSAATAYAGYRYQLINTEFDDSGDRADLTNGFAAGLTLSF